MEGNYKDFAQVAIEKFENAEKKGAKAVKEALNDLLLSALTAGAQDLADLVYAINVRMSENLIIADESDNKKAAAKADKMTDLYLELKYQLKERIQEEGMLDDDELADFLFLAE